MNTEEQEQERVLVATGTNIFEMMDFCYGRFTKENSDLEVKVDSSGKTEWKLYSKTIKNNLQWDAD